MAERLLRTMPDNTNPELHGLEASPSSTTQDHEIPLTRPAGVDHGITTSEEAQRKADAISAELAGMFPPRVQTAPAIPRVDIPISTAPRLTRRAFVGGAIATTVLGALGLKAWTSRGTNAATSVPTPNFVDGSKVPGGPAGAVPSVDGETPTARAAVGIADGTMTPTTDPNVLPALQTAETKWGNAWSTAVAGVNTQTAQGPDRTATPGITNTPDNRTAVPPVSPTKEGTPVPATYTFSSEVLQPGIKIPGAENLVEFPHFTGIELNPEYPNAAEAYKALCKQADAGTKVAYRNYKADELKYKYGKDHIRTASQEEIRKELDDPTPYKGLAFEKNAVLGPGVNVEKTITPGPINIELAMFELGKLAEDYLLNTIPLTDKLMARFAIDGNKPGRTLVLLLDKAYASDPVLLQKATSAGIGMAMSLLETPKAADNPEKFLYKNTNEDPEIDKLVYRPNPDSKIQHPLNGKNYAVTPLFVLVK